MRSLFTLQLVEEEEEEGNLRSFNFITSLEMQQMGISQQDFLFLKLNNERPKFQMHLCLSLSSSSFLDQ